MKFEMLEEIVREICTGNGHVYNSPNGKIYRLGMHSNDVSARLVWSIGQVMVPARRQIELFKEFEDETGIEKVALYNALNYLI